MTDGPTDHFSTVAAAYAAARPGYPAPLFAYLAGLAPGRRVAWDCGSGNGQAALALAAHFDRVIATDASRRQLGQLPRHPRVEPLVTTAESAALAARSVQLVTVAQALHWFRQEQFWGEVRRILVADGIIAVWCYGLHRVDAPAVDRLLERFYHSVVGPYWAPERRLVEDGYRTVPFPFEELPVPVPEFAMVLHWTLDQVAAYLRTWSATCRFVAAEGVDPVGPLAEELAPAWGAGRRAVRWPLSVRVGRLPPRSGVRRANASQHD